MTKGIDVSYHQVGLNFSKLQGVDFVILRASHGISEIDSMFELNYAQCKKLGIPVGCYHYYYYGNREKHEQETKNFLERIKGKTFELPVFIDYEESNPVYAPPLGALSRDLITEYALADLKAIKQAGFTAGIYANKNWLQNKLNADQFSQDVWIWLAQYNANPTYNGRFDIWQYTSQGHTEGYAGKLDMNICYRDLSKRIDSSLRVGSFGDLVTTMQELLQQQAYKIVVDGQFGRMTETVLKQFQLNNDLKPDGVCGPKTWEVLDSVRKYSLALDGEKYITKNFKIKEFRCKDGADEILISLTNAKNLQKARDQIGKPFHINSAYRTRAHNASEGGEDNSLHLYGLAVDFYVDGMSPAEVYALLNKTHKGGLGKYKSFTHLDCGRKRRWVR